MCQKKEIIVDYFFPLENDKYCCAISFITVKVQFQLKGRHTSFKAQYWLLIGYRIRTRYGADKFGFLNGYGVGLFSSTTLHIHVKVENQKPVNSQPPPASPPPSFLRACDFIIWFTGKVVFFSFLFSLILFWIYYVGWFVIYLLIRHFCHSICLCSSHSFCPKIFLLKFTWIIFYILLLLPEIVTDKFICLMMNYLVWQIKAKHIKKLGSFYILRRLFLENFIPILFSDYRMLVLLFFSIWHRLYD